MKIFKICLSVIIVLMIMFSCVPMASAYEVLNYEDYTLKSEDTGITISFYKGTDENVIIPDSINGTPVTKIDRGAFRNNNKLLSVTIPDSVETIGDTSFYACNNLKDVTLGAHVRFIGAEAFQWTAITSINLPDTLETIGRFAFSRTKLTEVTIPAKVSKIDDIAFSTCGNLKKVVLNEGLTEIGDSAFASCSMLSTINFPSTLKTIGESAFFECSALEDITLNNGLTAIGDKAFAGTPIIELVLPDSVEEIGKSCFYKCKKLNTVQISKGMDTIPSSAFAGCTSLTSFDIPANIVKVDGCAFMGCTGFTEFSFPDTVINVGVGIFENCTSLKKVRFPAGIEAIPRAFFSNCTAITELELPETVTEIGELSYSGTSIKSIVVPDRITTIGKEAFEKCNELTSVEIPSGVSQILTKTFSECPKLTNVILNEGVSTLGEEAFYNCKSLENLSLPSTITSIGDNCFEKCRVLKSITLNSGIKTLGIRAFYNCVAIENIELPESLTSIGSGCFSGCSSLQSIIVPEKIRYLEKNTFNNCTSLTSAQLPQNLYSIREAAFFGCKMLENISIPESVTFIGKQAFQSCLLIKKVELSSKVTGIDTKAFDNCTSLEKVYIRSPQAQIISYSIGYKYNSVNGKYEKLDVDTTVYGYYQSTAETYADKYGLKFNELSTNPEGVHTVIHLDTDTITLMQYRQKQIGYTIENSGGRTRFESTNPEVATVTQDGIIEAVSVGTAYIAITNTDATVVVEVNVTEPNVDIKNEQQNDDYKYYFVEDENNNIYVRITEYIGSKSDVVIPSEIGGYPVKIIGELAFSEERMNDVDYRPVDDTRPRITSLVIPEGVERLERSAFYGCVMLKSVKFPSTIKYIGDGLFYGKYDDFSGYLNIETIEFPSAEAFVRYMATATDAADYAEVHQNPYTNEVFSLPINTSFALPSYSPYTLLVNGKELTSIEIPEDMTAVPNYLLYNCKSIQSVTLPEGLEKVGMYAFYNCESLTSVELPASVSSIEECAFYGCTSLAEVDLPEYLETLGRYAYSQSGIKSVTIPETAAVNRCAFEDCKSLKTVFFNSKNKNCQLYGFIDGCDALESFSIGYGVIDIKSEVLTRITGSPTFYIYYNNTLYSACRNNNWNYVVLPYPWEEQENPETTESDLTPIPIYPNYFYDADTKTYTVTDKEGAISGEGAYPNGEAWYAKTVVFDFDSEVCLTQWCTQWFYSVENIVVKGNVRDIDNTAFNFASNTIKSVELSDNVRLISNGSFINCDSLTEIKGGKGLKTIGKEAFMNCTGLTDLGFASSVEQIGYSAFAGCIGLSDFDLPETLTKVGDYAFVNCTGVDEVEIPSSVTEIGKNAFGYRYNTEQNEYYPIVGFTIITDKGSAAEKYALENDFKIQYKQVDEPETPAKPAANKTPKLSASKLTLKAGKVKTIKVVNGNVKKWTTSNPKVALVKSGKVTALKKGAAEITAVLNTGKKLTCKLTVSNSPKLSKSTVSVKKGRTVSVKLKYKAASINNVYTKTKLAKITSKKNATTLKVKGLKRGTTTLKVKVNGVITLKLKVKVK